MSPERYKDLHNINYQPKHAKKTYIVWRVLGPAGPQEQFDVVGREEAFRSVLGCWDYEIRDKETGEIVL